MRHRALANTLKLNEPIPDQFRRQVRQKAPVVKGVGGETEERGRNYVGLKVGDYGRRSSHHTFHHNKTRAAAAMNRHSGEYSRMSQ